MGLSYGSHDTGASLIKNGLLITAIEEERLNRDKRTKAFPTLSIDYCLNKGGISISDVDFIIIPQSPSLLFKKTFLAQTRRFPHISIPGFFFDVNLILDLIRIRRRFSGLKKNISSIRFVDHHSAHAASAFLLSQFKKAAILTVDGIGEFATVTMSLGEGNQIRRLRTYEFPFSIGKLYGSICRYLGFLGHSKEGKVMGLAAYGDPSIFGPRFQQLASFDAENGVAFIDQSYFQFTWYRSPSIVSKKFIEEFGSARKPEELLSQRHKDIAAGLQQTLEQIVSKMLLYLYKLTGESKLCMAGGVALNSSLNGKIYELTPFTQIFIQPASSDAGLALGSALYYYNCILGKQRLTKMTHAYLGPDYSDEQVKEILDQAMVRYVKSEDIAHDVAKLLFDGKIVGWFQGRSEIGPRALGARSILADPRQEYMQDLINAKIKHRESFRPFAPVVIEEDASKYFLIDHPSPFMLEICKIRPEMIEILPAISHVDGTARLQTINETQNPLYYRLVKEFAKLTGIPVLLNTSFNDKDEPIVCDPFDAINCLKQTGLDILAIGNYIVYKV